MYRFFLSGLRALALMCLVFGHTNQAKSQSVEFGYCEDTAYCVPSVSGMPRSKAIEFNYENVARYSYKASSELSPDEPASGSYASEQRFQVKVRFPIYLGESWKVAAGFKYDNEEFRFKDLSNPNYIVGDVLDDRNLKSIGGRVYIVKSWRGNHYFALRAGADLNGDYTSDNQPKSDYLRVSVAPLFGLKKDANTLYGFGLAWGYNFGRASLYPFLVYNKTFNDRLGIESILPAKAAVRINFSDHTILYSGLALEGASYTIDPQRADLNQFSSLHLQRSEIRVFASLERELHDFLWMNFEAGVRFNYRFEVTDDAVFNPVSIVGVSRSPAFYIKTGIFLVPPRKFVD